MLICIAISGCYKPQPAAGAPCGPDRSCPDPLVCSAATSTCERTDSPGDAATTDTVTSDAVDPLDEHLHAADQAEIRALADLTGVVPYKADDYTDGTTTPGHYDNAPNGVSALYPPFTGTFAVTAGRAIIEVSASAAPRVHDYRPAVPDMAGPDNLYRLGFGAPADTGPMLWGTGASVLGGDGLFTFDANWVLHRDNALNNVTGVVFDPQGGYDDIGTGTMYFIDQAGFERRDTATTRTAVSPSTSNHDDIAITRDAMYGVFYPSDNTSQLVRIAKTTHEVTVVDAADVIDVVQGVSFLTVFAIRNERELVAYQPDGSAVVVAYTSDLDWHWRGATLVDQQPHPNENAIVIVESNRTLNRDRLIVVTSTSSF